MGRKKKGKGGKGKGGKEGKEEGEEKEKRKGKGEEKGGGKKGEKAAHAGAAQPGRPVFVAQRLDAAPLNEIAAPRRVEMQPTAGRSIRRRARCCSRLPTATVPLCPSTGAIARTQLSRRHQLCTTALCSPRCQRRAPVYDKDREESLQSDLGLHSRWRARIPTPRATGFSAHAGRRRRSNYFVAPALVRLRVVGVGLAEPQAWCRRARGPPLGALTARHPRGRSCDPPRLCCFSRHAPKSNAQYRAFRRLGAGRARHRLADGRLPHLNAADTG